VAELAGSVSESAVELAVHNNSSPHAFVDIEKDHVPEAREWSRPKPKFSQGRESSSIFKIQRNIFPNPRSQDFPHLDECPPTQVLTLQDGSLDAVDQANQADAYSSN
jgi:hypothetical protein